MVANCDIAIIASLYNYSQSKKHQVSYDEADFYWPHFVSGHLSAVQIMLPFKSYYVYMSYAFERHLSKAILNFFKNSEKITKDS
jgi:hypothetical protein